MTEPEAFLGRILSKLQAAGVPHMVTGSLASSYHGVPRTTHGVDIVIDPSEQSLRDCVRSLPGEVYYVDQGDALNALASHSVFNVIEHASGWKADLILVKDRAYSRAEFDRREPCHALGDGAFIVTKEDAVISKLEWAERSGSQKQVDDVLGVLATSGSLDMGYLEPWIEELGLQDQWNQLREH